jgi:DNA polymerase-3 subunit gamma/tau
VRDALSLLDQAIAHHAGDGASAITADSVRSMLGLADRGRVLDLFEKLMAGEIAPALGLLRNMYDAGADPLVVMQDLLETTHFLTRVKIAPGAEGFFDGGSAEAQRAVTVAGKLSVAALTRAWQMLLKGLIEVRDAANPLPAAEMALVRLAYASDLPPTEKLVRSLRDGNAPAAQLSSPQAGSRGPAAGIRSQAQARAAPRPAPEQFAPPQSAGAGPAIDLARLEDIVALAKAKGARLLATQLENSVHLVSLERGRIEFRPARGASGTLASDLGQRLREWTGERWIVTLASEGGAPSIYEQRQAAEQARKDAVSQEPFVRAVLDTFPGAEIVAVRERQDDTPPPISDEESA